jgi:hypothetical protein
MATDELPWFTVESDLLSAVSPHQVDTPIIRTNPFHREMNITNNVNDKIDVLLNLVTDMTKLTQQMINQQRHSSQIPIYVSPSSMSLLTDFSGDEDEFVAKNWLPCTENIITMNNWHAGLAVACIQPHMQGAASYWFQDKAPFASFEDFKEKFSRSFCQPESITEKFKRMLSRRQNEGESAQSYFLEKKYLCNELTMSPYEVVQAIAEGFLDHNLSMHLLSRKRADFDILLNDVRSYEKLVKSYISDENCNTFQPITNRNFKHQIKQQVHKGLRCKKYGDNKHSIIDCPIVSMKCFKCNQFGHIVIDCHNSAKNIINIISSTAVEKEEKYFKKATINGMECNCMIGPGRSVCLITESCFRKMNIVPHPCNESVFSYGAQKPTYKVKQKVIADITIDNVKVESVPLFVVMDSAQHIDLLIGQTWTEHPNVAFLKLGNQLIIGTSESFKSTYRMASVESAVSINNKVNFVEDKS